MIKAKYNEEKTRIMQLCTMIKEGVLSDDETDEESNNYMVAKM